MCVWDSCLIKKKVWRRGCWQMINKKYSFLFVLENTNFSFLLFHVVRPTPELVSAVKSVYQERNLDAKFLIPIVSGLGKVIKNQSLLDNYNKSRKKN